MLGRAALGLGLVLAAAGAWRAYTSTVPYDPLAEGQRVSAVFDGMKRGDIVTAIYPLSTTSGERAVIVHARPVSNSETRIVSLHGVSTAQGFTLGGADPRTVARHDGGVLRPVRGLRFTTADQASSRSWLYTHVWLDETVEVLQADGCLELPALDLRYRVGRREFDRVVRAPAGLAGVGTDGSTCLSNG
jgi:hypothetical protein